MCKEEEEEEEAQLPQDGLENIMPNEKNIKGKTSNKHVFECTYNKSIQKCRYRSVDNVWDGGVR
eukprot:CAMPEP_0177578402 /NCGR_PEP_ID=MMETSP0419_2-20121207/329_1 /TAXON_ID=582737 /ORGANISM="Tetraselmis sp., Strain GSL018" /LENGTH=63 /DNA_ID=CAMNT_0019066843 /DNA_START=1493 /DNA_END=1684 /DNA_ORIENTATION=+